MPRKVLITKDTLEEILAKYQGGGSASGGSGKLYVYSFDIEGYDENGDLTQDFQNAQNRHSMPIILGYYEQNFERTKNDFNQNLSNHGVSINTPQDLATLINTSFDETVAISGTAFNNIILGELINNADFAFSYLMAGPQNSIKWFMELSCDLINVLYVATGRFNTLFSMYTLVNDEDWGIGLNTNNSCTLTEYGTSSQGGGTVEAEPIVSIKMTNLNVKDLESNSDAIRDFYLYCSKDRWNSFVQLAKSMFNIDLTYNNFDSSFKSLDVQNQSLAIGYLMYDYYNKKILPQPIIVGSANNINIYSQIEYIIVGQASGENIITDASWTRDDDNLGASGFPSCADRTSKFSTANTVITVEEIAGASIGSSSGSGTSDVLYKHSFTAYYKVDENKVAGVISFLSKYDTPFATNGSLADFLDYYVGLDDEFGLLCPMFTNAQTNSVGIIAGIYPDTTRGFITISLIASGNIVNAPFYFTDNTSGITDTVTPYIQVSGGSSSGGTELDKVTIHVGPNFSASGSINFTFERTQFDAFLTVVNSGLAQQGMAITITRDNFNTVTNQLFNNTNVTNTQKLRVIAVMAMHQISSYYIDASDGYVSNNLLFSLSGIQFGGTNCDIFDGSDGSYARYGFVSIELL